MKQGEEVFTPGESLNSEHNPPHEGDPVETGIEMFKSRHRRFCQLPCIGKS
jgi:hypothetical protein